MTTLTDDILKGGNLPQDDFFAGFLIEGTTEAVENKLKEEGWDGKSPRASIIIHFESSEIRHVQMILSGKREIGRTLATTLWGNSHHKESYVKFDALDLSVPIFINKMTSGLSLIHI